jgi:hypothetical protein
MWTLVFGHHEDRSPIHGYAAARDAAVAAFAKNWRRDDWRVFLYAFDLIELDGDDLRHQPIERRKAELAKLIRRAKAGLVLNGHIDEPGDVVFRHARASSGSRASCRSGSARAIGRVIRRTG